VGEVGPTYRLATSTGSLRQGEILSSVNQHIIKSLPESPSGAVTVELITHPFAVVLTQDCDLAQDFSGRTKGTDVAIKQGIPNVLLCELDLAENMKRNGSIAAGSDIWKRVIQNKDDRFQYLREVSPESDLEASGIEALIVDFKLIFTLPTDVLYRQLDTVVRRRCVLISPYVEHLCSRYAYFLSRVALPIDHHVSLGTNIRSTE
jgi:hypothetical protein